MKLSLKAKNQMIDSFNNKESEFVQRIKSLNHENSALKDKMAQANIEVISLL